jgi:RNA polymerase sigma-70 factor, ECF subfamily
VALDADPAAPTARDVNETGPPQELIERERAELVRDALDRLPDTHRVIVILREYEGMKCREIADVLDIPEGTVKWRMADALTKLSRHLKPLASDETRRQRGAVESTTE